jgi:hypothetical protein
VSWRALANIAPRGPHSAATRNARGSAALWFQRSLAGRSHSPGVVAHVVGFLAPDTQSVVQGTDPAFAPEDEHGTGERAGGIGGVVGEIDRRARAVVLAAGVNRRLVEATAALRERISESVWYAPC